MNRLAGQGAWWKDLYDERLAELVLARPDEEVAAEVSFLTNALDLGPGDRVFDQCCGIGSLSIPLARSAMAVVGIDQCGAYIRRARRDAEAVGVGVACDFREADACAFVADPPCDAAFNWWTSFGYAEDDRRNALMLQRAFDSLRPGGWFVLDFQNIARVLRDFRPCMVRRGVTPEGEVLLLRESTLDLPQGVLRQVWTFVLPDGQRVVRSSALRLYLPHALADLLRGCGFVDVEFFGTLDAGPLTQDSPRCIARARRPSP
jgi:SAM-dependent methyltransferase